MRTLLLCPAAESAVSFFSSFILFFLSPPRVGAKRNSNNIPMGRGEGQVSGDWIIS